MRNSKKILLYALPAFVLILFLIIGVLYAFYLSFTNMSLIGRAAKFPRFIGVENYLKIFRDAEFLNSLKVSFIFTIFSALIGQTILGLLLAVFLKNKLKFKTVIVSVVMLSWIIPDMVAVYIWGAFTAPSGTLNTILNIFNLESVRWLSDKPLLTVIVANIWRGTAFSMMLFSSALETIPQHLYEAASIDGASKWRRFWNITLPLLTPTILVDLILITMWTFGYFTLVYGLTGGGPGHLTEIFPVFIYNQAFSHYKIGYGSALSFVMMFILALISSIYFILLKKAERMTE